MSTVDATLRVPSHLHHHRRLGDDGRDAAAAVDGGNGVTAGDDLLKNLLRRYKYLY